MVVTVVLEPITRICPDSGSGFGGGGMEAGAISFESGRESLNMEHFLKERRVTKLATNLFYLNVTITVTFTLSYASDKI